MLCPQWSLSKCVDFQIEEPPAQLVQGTLSSQGVFLSSWGGEHWTPPPSQATERRLRLLHPNPSQNHNIITTTTWDRKPSGNLTSISILLKRSAQTPKEINPLQFSFYLFSVHCGREQRSLCPFRWAAFHERCCRAESTSEDSAENKGQLACLPDYGEMSLLAVSSLSTPAATGFNHIPARLLTKVWNQPKLRRWKLTEWNICRFLSC